MRDEKNRGPVLIQLDEHDQEGAGAEARFREAQIGGREFGGQGDFEEVRGSARVLGAPTE